MRDAKYHYVLELIDLMDAVPMHRDGPAVPIVDRQNHHFRFRSYQGHLEIGRSAKIPVLLSSN